MKQNVVTACAAPEGGFYYSGAPMLDYMLYRNMEGMVEQNRVHSTTAPEEVSDAVNVSEEAKVLLQTESGARQVNIFVLGLYVVTGIIVNRKLQ